MYTYDQQAYVGLGEKDNVLYDISLDVLEASHYLEPNQTPIVGLG